MKYVFDLDGTLCTNTFGDYEKAKPIEDRIRMLNILYSDGNKIVIHTARGMNTCNGDIYSVYEKYYSLTVQQLASWGIKYHQLILGKPAGDFYIDDKGVNDEDYFGTNIRP